MELQLSHDSTSWWLCYRRILLLGGSLLLLCCNNQSLSILQVSSTNTIDSSVSSSYLRTSSSAYFDSSDAATPTSSRFLQTVQCEESCCQDAFPCPPEEPADPASFDVSAVPLAAQILLIVLLIALSSLFSGLTLGMMSLDISGLEIVMAGDDEANARYAKRIYPIRKRGNQLLCTLILGNVVVNALLSILLADKAGGLVGFISSTALIVVFGEIAPQALCGRYPLYVGSKAVPLVRLVIVVFFPIAYPLAFCLDKLLGKELATTYSNAEMLMLLQIQVHEKVLDHETAIAMRGALRYKDILVQDVMTSVEKTFMLSSEDKLNFETVANIFQSGYSRIPVYEVNKNNVIGLLFVKDLIFIDPDDATPIRDVIEVFGRSLVTVWVDDKLGDILRQLKKCRSHMALVRDVNNEQDEVDPFYELKGIVTLEDIIEEILGEEIVDETDQHVDDSETLEQRTEKDRADTVRWASLRFLDSKIVDRTLSFDEARAVTAHLQKNYSDVVSLLTEHQLFRLVSECPVTVFPTATQEIGMDLPKDLLYEKGVPSDCCTLIVAGKVTVLVGGDNFRTDVSNWGVIATGALEDSSYVPDFSAFVSSGPCRCLRITRDRFSVAVDASAVERQSAPRGTKASASDKLQHDTPTRKKNMMMAALQVVGGKPSAPGQGRQGNLDSEHSGVSSNHYATGEELGQEIVFEKAAKDAAANHDACLVLGVGRWNDATATDDSSHDPPK